MRRRGSLSYVSEETRQGRIWNQQCCTLRRQGAGRTTTARAQARATRPRRPDLGAHYYVVYAVKSDSVRSRPAVSRERKINLYEYAIVQCGWTAPNVLEKGDVTRNEGADYTARLYITCEYDFSEVGFFDKANY